MSGPTQSRWLHSPQKPFLGCLALGWPMKLPKISTFLGHVLLKLTVSWVFIPVPGGVFQHRKDDHTQNIWRHVNAKHLDFLDPCFQCEFGAFDS